MVFRKIAGAFKTMGGKLADTAGRIKVGAFKYGPDILEYGSLGASLVPGPHQPIAAAVYGGVKGARSALEGVPNEEVKQKLMSELDIPSKTQSTSISEKPIIGVSSDGTPVRDTPNNDVRGFSSYIPQAMTTFRQIMNTREKEARGFRKGHTGKVQKYNKRKKKN